MHILFQYAVKFVCGKSDGQALASGVYYTAINVHNPTYKDIAFRKKVAITLPSEPFAYITNFNDNNVSVVDTASNTVTATISVGSGPFGIAVTPNGAFVYVTNQTSNTVSVVDTASNTVTATIPVGSTPFGIAVTPDGAFVYVGNANDNNVSVIDTASNTVTATVPVELNPFGIAVTPNGAFVYVANVNSNTVSVIDTTTNTVTTTIPVANLPHGVAVTPNGAVVYVTNQFSNDVSVIDTTTNTITATILVGNSPYGVAVTPDGAFVYVTNFLSNTVSVVDTASNTVTATIVVENSPDGVAVTPDGTFVYLANELNNNVSVIDTDSNTVTATVPVGSNPTAFGKFIGPAPEKAGRVSHFFDAKLGPDEALEIDCPDIRRHAETDANFLKGFVVIESGVELDIVAVYTAAGATGQVETFHTERVTPRRHEVGLPDLVPVPDPQPGVGFCRRDERGNLIVTVSNQGTSGAGPSVSTVDFGSFGTVSMPTPPLAPGASVDLLFLIPSGCFNPDCEFRIIVDANNQVVESNEGNNFASGTCIG